MQCPNGHHWSSALSRDEPRLCPECGSTAFEESVEEGEDFEDELPPAPSTLLKSHWPIEAASGRPAKDEVSTLTLPERIGGFEVLEVVGRGGMGVVYRARQLSLGRIVALKVLAAGPLASPAELARFRAEAEALAKLSHPHVIHIYDVGVQNGLSYLACEFIDGGTLADRMHGPWDPREAARLVRTLAEAIEFVHARSIVHRDLKPANVLLTRDGTPKITDFGLVRNLDGQAGRTESGVIVGTPSYMAPEQAQGKTRATVGPAADIYALGVILYELLTGRPPFVAETTWETLKLVVEQPPVSPSRVSPTVPEALSRICLKCLAKQPEQRFPSAAALADALRAFLDDRPTATGSPLNRNRRWMPIVAGACVLLTTVTLGIWRPWNTPPNGPQPGAPPQTAQNNRGDSPSPRNSAPAASTPRSSPARLKWDVTRIAAQDEKFDRLSFPTANVGFAASRTALYRTTDGGLQWTRIGAHPVGRVYALRFANDSSGWLAADRLLRTGNAGKTWQDVSIPSAEPVKSLTALLTDHRGLLVGGRSVRGNLVLFRFPAGDGMAASELDLVGQADWKDGPDAYRQWFLSQLILVDSRRVAAIVYSGTQLGGAVLFSEDFGETWRIVLQTPVDVFRAAFAAGNGRGCVVGDGGRVWMSKPGGSDWTQAVTHDAEGLTPSCVALDATGDRGVAPLRQGTALVRNGGEEWQHVSIPNFDEYSLADAVFLDASTALVLGSQGHLARLTFVSP